MNALNAQGMFYTILRSSPTLSMATYRNLVSTEAKALLI